MRIWFAACIPKDSYGGVNRSMVGLSQHLDKKGHLTKIIYCPAKWCDNFVLFASYLFLRVIAAGKNKPDWVVARSTDGLLCGVAHRWFGLPTKLALHNHGWEELVAECEKRLPKSIVTSPTTWKAKLFRFNMLRLTLRLCDACVNGTVSETRWISGRYSEVRSKCRYVPNGVERRNSAFWNEQASRPGNFLVVGGPTWKKNIQYAEDVFVYIKKRIPDAKLFITGTGNYHPAGSSCCEAVTYIPAVNWDEMDKWYSSCPYLISTSRFEGGHSLAVLEAMSYGVLVFVSPIKSTTEFVRNGKNGCVLSCVNATEDAAVVCGVVEQNHSFDYIRSKAFVSAMNNTWNRTAGRLERALCKNM